MWFWSGCGSCINKGWVAICAGSGAGTVLHVAGAGAGLENQTHAGFCIRKLCTAAELKDSRTFCETLNFLSCLR